MDFSWKDLKFKFFFPILSTLKTKLIIKKLNQKWEEISIRPSSILKTLLLSPPLSRIDSTREVCFSFTNARVISIIVFLPRFVFSSLTLAFIETAANKTGICCFCALKLKLSIFPRECCFLQYHACVKWLWVTSFLMRKLRKNEWNSRGVFRVFKGLNEKSWRLLKRLKVRNCYCVKTKTFRTAWSRSWHLEKSTVFVNLGINVKQAVFFLTIMSLSNSQNIIE